jgi:hypothetical protein
VAAPRAALQEQSRNVGVLGLKGADDGQMALARSIQDREIRRSNTGVASVFGRDTALGNDAQDVLGSLAGNQIGEVHGVGGLGLVGTGSGGGGTGEHTIGLGNLGTIGKYSGGEGNGSGYSRGVGGLGGRRSRAPDVIPGVATIRGSLDKEIVRRIIRRHINEVRYCYDQALAKKPDLGGRIVAQFTISGDGKVLASVIQSSTLGSPTVELCVANAIKHWEFPKPLGGGLVIASYPFVLTPAGGEENGVQQMAPAPPPLPSRPIDNALAILSIGAGHERIERIATVLGLRPLSNAEALAWTINRQQDGGFETRLLVARLLEFAHNRRDAIRVLSEAAAAHAEPTAAELRRMGADGDAFDVLRLANR